MPFKNAEFPYRIQNVLECEFHLLETMDCCLILYHPYRPLLQVSRVGCELFGVMSCLFTLSAPPLPLSCLPRP